MKRLAAIFAAALSMGVAWQTPNHPAVPREKTSPPTFYKDVLPILQDHCQSCHRPGEAAPMPLMTYEQARPWAGKMAAAVEMKMMPPWLPIPGTDTSRTIPR